MKQAILNLKKEYPGGKKAAQEFNEKKYLEWQEAEEKVWELENTFLFEIV